MMYCRYCGSEDVRYLGIDDGGGDYGDSFVNIFHCDGCGLDIEGKDVLWDELEEDVGYECIMCGKSISKHSGERCSRCEQVWNS